MKIHSSKIILSACLILFATGYFASAQVKIGTNPTQIVNGAKLQVDGTTATTDPSKLIVTGSGNVGVGNANPNVNLDVTGAIANREPGTAVTVDGATSVSLPDNVSQVRITGTPSLSNPALLLNAKPAFAINGPAGSTVGQRLVVYNNTSGGFPGILNGFLIPAGQTVEFSYSNSGWRAQQAAYAQVFAARLQSVTGITQVNGFTDIPFSSTINNNSNISYNTINGSTVNYAAGTITLPVGTYRASASVLVQFGTTALATQITYADLIFSYAGSSYNSFGRFNCPSTGVNFQNFINGTCIFKVVSGTVTVKLSLYTNNASAANQVSVANGGLTNNILEIQRLD